MRLANQNHASVRDRAHQPAEGPQRFSDALVRLEEPEHADQRSPLLQFHKRAQPCPIAHAIRRRGPSSMGNPSHGTFKSLCAKFRAHRIAVDNRAARGRKHRPHHRQAVVRSPLPRPNIALGIILRLGAVVAPDGAHVSVPVVAMDGEIRDQVVQVGFVHDHDSRVFRKPLHRRNRDTDCCRADRRRCRSGMRQRPRVWRRRFLPRSARSNAPAVPPNSRRYRSWPAAEEKRRLPACFRELILR